MGSWVCLSFFQLMCFFSLLLSETCTQAAVRYIGQTSPGFEGSQVNYIDNGGLFLFSNNSNFAFGFWQTDSLLQLVVLHVSSSTIVWTAGRGTLVKNSDKFVFGNDGDVYLEVGGGKVWSTDTSNKGVTALTLQDTGNLVVIGNDSKPLWQSFSYPTDTLLSNQVFFEGMRLVSNPSPNNLTCYLEIKSGDLMLYANFQSPQPYWSMRNDVRTIINKVNGNNVYSASLTSKSWRLYDRDQVLIWQFIFSSSFDPNVTIAAVLDSSGVISFNNLQNKGSTTKEITIPQDSCRTPGSCAPFYVCSKEKQCDCPSYPSSHPNCTIGAVSQCDGSTELVTFGNRFYYSPLDFVSPFSQSDLQGCKDTCLANCLCLVLFFENSSGNCFLFDQIGSLQQLNGNSTRFVSYIKMSNKVEKMGFSSNQKSFLFIVTIVVVFVFAIIGVICMGITYIREKKKVQKDTGCINEEDSFLDSLPGMPRSYCYKELETATNNFSMKLGKGGFGTVYQGCLSDETQVAVKKLEGIDQGNKEFRAEVSSIGSIRHVHLVKLKGFCAEGIHRLLVYEYMANGSLDKWIFKKDSGNFVMDWGRRFNIALGMAKGLAYLHEDCVVKIIHCDVKPENVLLDANFEAKVSDFGLAKLMTKEESRVFTKLRGTRGYLAPEWIMNRAISEKSDVYSFGVVLLEIIRGRKNFDPAESSGKANLTSYALKMAEEGKLGEIVDPMLMVDEEDERLVTAVMVALWCIQGDMHLRPSMSEVVKMLEGTFNVPQLPISGNSLYSGFSKLLNKEATSPGALHDNSDAHFSIEFSGAR